MDKPQGYSRLQITLHWIIALLIVGQFVFHERMESAWDAVERGATVDMSQAMPHVIGGTLVLVLVIWRLMLRRKRGAPALPADGNPVLDMIAHATHWLLYALMILVPISGLAAWFGGVEAAAEAHGAMFIAMGLLVILHIAGAIYHQWIKKDGLIGRMMRAR